MKRSTKFLLAAGYLLGMAAALKYDKKTRPDIQKQVCTGKSECCVIRNRIISIHKALFADIKQALWTEEVQQTISKKKDQVVEWAEEFRVDALEKIEELKGRGVDLAKK